MAREEAPVETYAYFGLNNISIESITQEKTEYQNYLNSQFSHLNLSQQSIAEGLELILGSCKDKDQAMNTINQYANTKEKLDEKDTIAIAHQLFNDDELKAILYRLTLELRFS